MTTVTAVAESDAVRELLPCALIADLKLRDAPDGTKFVQVLHGTTVGDGNGGEFYWSASSAATGDDFYVVVPTGHTGNGRWLRMTINGLGTVPSVVSIAALKAMAKPTAGSPVVTVASYYASATPDGGGGQFVWDSSSSDADNGGTIIAPDAGGTGRWRRVYTGALRAAWFGAIAGQSSATITTALQAMLDAVLSSGGTVDATDLQGAFTLSTTLTISKAGTRFYMPNTGRITASVLPAISVSTGISGVELYGKSMGSDNGTIFRWAGTTGGSFITFARDANYPKVHDVLLETTGALTAAVYGIRATDILGFDFDRVFASDATSGSHVNRLTAVLVEVATLSQVPVRGFGRIGNIIRTSSDVANISAVTGSRAIELKGIAGTNGSVQFVHIHGFGNVKDVEAGIRLEKAGNVSMNGSWFFQGNARDFVLVDADSNTFVGPYARASGGAFAVEHANVDAASFDNFFLCDFGDSGFGTNSGNRTVILNSATQDFDWGNVPAKNILVKNGIAFPATQQASAGANTLDDYEEGTWTPADGSGAGLSLTVDSAQFVKVGQLVMVTASIFYPATADGTNAKVSGLPFSSQNTTNSVAGGSPSYTTAGAITILINSNSTGMSFFNTSGTEQTNANLSGKIIRFSLVYRASS